MENYVNSTCIRCTALQDVAYRGLSVFLGQTLILPLEKGVGHLVGPCRLSTEHTVSSVTHDALSRTSRFWKAIEVFQSCYIPHGWRTKCLDCEKTVLYYT